MTDVRQYATSAEREILRVFAHHDILVASYGCKQGPQTLTYALRLIQNTLEQRSKALRLSKVIEGAIMDTPVRMRDRNGYIYVEIPSPVAVPVLAPNLTGEGLAVPVGMTASRSVRGLDFANQATAHTVIVAASGKGKTTAGRSLLYGLARQNSAQDVRIAVATFKPKDWNAYGDLPHLLDIALEGKEIVRILKWANAEVYKRSRSGVDSPRYVIVLDDMFNWGKQVDVGEYIGQIASLGRAAGFNLLILTQRMTAEGLGNASAAVANITTRLVLGAGSASEAAQLTGLKGTGAELLGRYPGDALLVNGGSAVRLACASVSDDAVHALARGISRNVSFDVPWVDLEGGKTSEPPLAGLPSSIKIPSESGREGLLRKVGNVPVAGPRTFAIVPLGEDATDARLEAARARTTPPSLPESMSLETVSSDIQVSTTEVVSTEVVDEGEPARLALPLKRLDPPTPEQVAEIVRVWEETGHRMNQTIITCYGAKGLRTSDLVHKALTAAGIAWKEEDDE